MEQHPFRPRSYACMEGKRNDAQLKKEGRGMITVGLMLLIPASIVVAALMSANADWNAEHF